VGAVSRLAGLLEDGGYLFIETPSIDGLDRRLFGRGYWGGYHIPRHFWLFNEESLERLLKTAGLEMKEIRYLCTCFWIVAGRVRPGSSQRRIRFCWLPSRRWIGLRPRWAARPPTFELSRRRDRSDRLGEGNPSRLRRPDGGEQVVHAQLKAAMSELTEPDSPQHFEQTERGDALLMFFTFHFGAHQADSVEHVQDWVDNGARPGQQ
jgi:hypothetical protein